MKKQIVAALALSLVLVGLNVRAEADKKAGKPASIKAVMKAHKKGGVIDATKAALKAKDWDAASAALKTWVKLADDLGKNTPKKGSKDSWAKQTGTYDKTVHTLAAAVAAKNSAQANGALGKIGTTCKSCHSAHK